jgi:HD-GYP domain-containing protein (c-di-GMP phosphodiesterase class II)
MYVSDIGRSWFNHPWKSKCKLLSSYAEIEQLLDYKITEVTVDTDKSLFDPEPEPSPAPRQVVPCRPPQIRPEAETGVEMELPRAAVAYGKALDTSKALIAACRMNKKIEISEVKENIDGLVESVSRNREALVALMKLRNFDDYSYTHSLNVSVLAISAGKTLGLSDEELKTLGLGTMFHDLGKTKIPASILNKPGKLTEEEFSIMRGHAVMSGRIILEQKLPISETVFQIAKHHHERSDGSGYPDRLKGQEIPYLVTVCGLSDVYDALTSDRVYHKGRSPHDALKFIYSLRGTHFEAQWVDRFVQSVGIYPPGTVVQLNSDQVAVVMDINPGALHAPLVKIIADATGMLYVRPTLLNLSKPAEAMGLKVKRVVPRAEAGFDPGCYFNSPET